MRVDYANESLNVWRDSTKDDPEADVVLTKGALVTIDGASGEIWFHA